VEECKPLAAGDTTCSVESAAAVLVVAASHVNHAPTGCEGTACAASGNAGADIAVTLTGADVDHDAPLTFSLTSLPAKGTLLVSGGSAVAAAGMAVPGRGLHSSTSQLNLSRFGQRAA